MKEIGIVNDGRYYRIEEPEHVPLYLFLDGIVVNVKKDVLDVLESKNMYGKEVQEELKILFNNNNN